MSELTHEVVVLHNVSRENMFSAVGKGSKFFHAHTFQLALDCTCDPDDEGTCRWTVTCGNSLRHPDQLANLAEQIWIMTNIGTPERPFGFPDEELRTKFGPQVEAYRNAGNRSLSVGDILVFSPIGDKPVAILAAASLGFTMMEAVPAYTDTDPTAQFSASFEAHQAWADR